MSCAPASQRLPDGRGNFVYRIVNKGFDLLKFDRLTTKRSTKRAFWRVLVSARNGGSQNDQLRKGDHQSRHPADVLIEIFVLLALPDLLSCRQVRCDSCYKRGETDICCGLG